MPVNDISPEEAKELLKQALKEWLDDQFTTFGKWSAASIAAVLFSGMIYVALHAMGWHR